MATLKEQVAEAATAVKDDTGAMVCFYRPKVGADYASDEWGPRVRCGFAELPEREFDEGYGGREGEPFIGFTERFVYVCGTYDGAEWIDAVPRSPEVVEATGHLPVIGGG